MSASDYEYLLRRIYQCGRDASKGAEAGIYTRLEHAEIELDEPRTKKSQELRQRDRDIAFAEVRMHLRNGLRHGITKVKSRASKSDLNQLDAIKTELQSAHFYDRKRLDEIIDEADLIFEKLGLAMG